MVCADIVFLGFLRITFGHKGKCESCKEGAYIVSAVHLALSIHFYTAIDTVTLLQPTK